MVTEQEQQAIIASCVLGVVFFLILLVIIMCFTCRRRKHHKKRDHTKHHYLPQHVSPNHSQPSTLKTTVNSTLPKAGSTGLWMDTPGMYGLAPPHNYYYGRPHPHQHPQPHPQPHGYKPPGMDHGYNLPRAVSENRIPQAGPPYLPYRPQFGSQNNVFMLPMPSQRFYHSQPLTPVYELPPARGMEIYDYPYPGVNGGFRSKLLETRHTPDYYNTSNSEFILQPRVERSKSDAEERKPTRPLNRREPSQEIITTTPVENERRLSTKEIKNWYAFKEDDEKQLLNPFGPERVTRDSVHRGPHVFNDLSSNIRPTEGVSSSFTVHNSNGIPIEHLGKRTDSVDNTTVSSSENMPSSATDSMKLLAKNKTDDQKTKPGFTPVVVDSKVNTAVENNREFNVKHYTYEGSIYAMPEKNIRNDDYDNPIISRMKEMVLERSRHSAHWNNGNDSHNARESTTDKNGAQTKVPEPTSFQDVPKVTKVTKTKGIDSTKTHPDRINTDHQTSTYNLIVDGLHLPDILVPEDEKHPLPSSRPPTQHKSNDSKVAAALSGTKNDHREQPRPVTDRVKDRLSPKGSVDTVEGSEDLNIAGKQLAASAFEFLDNYLSDDDGTESMFESPPLSPAGRKAGQVY